MRRLVRVCFGLGGFRLEFGLPVDLQNVVLFNCSIALADAHGERKRKRSRRDTNDNGRQDQNMGQRVGINLVRVAGEDWCCAGIGLSNPGEGLG